MYILTTFIFECYQTFPAVWTFSIRSHDMFSHTALTEQPATPSIAVLVRVSGHTQADLTLEVIRRLLYPLTVIASNCFLINAHLSSVYTVVYKLSISCPTCTHTLHVFVCR